MNSNKNLVLMNSNKNILAFNQLLTNFNILFLLNK
jgi:hypothetical protein